MKILSATQTTPMPVRPPIVIEKRPSQIAIGIIQGIVPSPSPTLNGRATLPNMEWNTKKCSEVFQQKN